MFRTHSSVVYLCVQTFIITITALIKHTVTRPTCSADEHLQLLTLMFLDRNTTSSCTLYLLGQMLTILIIFGSIAAEKICKQMTFLSYNIQFMYEYYTIENTRDILYAFNASASSCHHASFLQLFQKLVQSPQPACSFHLHGLFT